MVEEIETTLQKKGEVQVNLTFNHPDTRMGATPQMRVKCFSCSWGEVDNRGCWLLCQGKLHSTKNISIEIEYVYVYRICVYLYIYIYIIQQWNIFWLKQGPNMHQMTHHQFTMLLKGDFWWSPGHDRPLMWYSPISTIVRDETKTFRSWHLSWYNLRDLPFYL